MSLAGELKDFNSNFQAAYKATKPTAADKYYEQKTKESQEESARQNQAMLDGVDKAERNPIRISGERTPVAGEENGEIPAKYVRKIPAGDSAKIEGQFIGALKAGGLTNPYGLAAMAATGLHESGYSAGNVNRQWSDPSQSGQPGMAGGLLSWRAERLSNMRKMTGGAEDMIAAQAKFALTENPGLTQALQNAKSADEANRLMANSWKYAGYNRSGGEFASRLASTRRYALRFLGKEDGGEARVQQASTGTPKTDPLTGRSAAAPVQLAPEGGAIPSMTRAPTFAGSAVPEMTIAPPVIEKRADLEEPYLDDESALPTTYAATGGLVEEPEEGSDTTEIPETADSADYVSEGGQMVPTPARLARDPETTGSIGRGRAPAVIAPDVAAPDPYEGYDPRGLARPNRNALEAGVDWIKRTFFPDEEGAVETGDTTLRRQERQTAFARNVGELTTEERQVVDDTVDPRRQLSPTERRIAGMNGLYEYFINKGDLKSAQKYAGAMLMVAKRHVAEMGAYAEAAYERGDLRTMGKAMSSGMDAWPDGRSVQFGRPTRDGQVPYKLIGDDGEMTEEGLLRANDMLRIATGMQNGTAVLNQMAGVLRGKSAAEFRKEREGRAAQEADDAALDADLGQNQELDYARVLKRQADAGDENAARALEAYQAAPQAYKKAKQRQFMQVRKQQLAEEKEQRAIAAREAKAKKEAEEAAAEKGEAQKETAFTNNAYGQIDQLTAAAQALRAAKTSDAQDPREIAAAQRAYDDAAKMMHETLTALPSGYKDAGRLRSAAAAAMMGREFGSSSRGAAEGGAGGGAGAGAGGGTGAGGGGRGGSVDERAEARAEQQRRDRTLNINRGEIAAETAARAQTMGGADVQGPMDNEGEGRVAGIRAGAETERRAARADEAYKNAARENAVKFDDSEMKGFDEQLQSAWTEKQVDPATGRERSNKPMTPDELRRHRRIVVEIMKGNPSLGSDEAARIALAAADPEAKLDFDDNSRLAMPGLPPVYFGASGIEAARAIHRTKKAQNDKLIRERDAAAKKVTEDQRVKKTGEYRVYEARLRRIGIDPAGKTLQEMRNLYVDTVRDRQIESGAALPF